MLVQYPFTDNSGSKVRPAIIVSGDSFNTGDDVIFVPVSSIDRGEKHDYPIPANHRCFRQAGLKHGSFVKWTKPATVSRQLFVRRLGSLDAETLGELHEKIRGLFTA